MHASAAAGIETRYHQTTWCANEAIAFMSEPRKGPWLMSVNPFDPHPQGAFFSAPREYLDKYDPASLPGPHFRESDLENQARLRNVDFQSTATPPEEYPAREMQAAYYASIELIDAQVGRMLEALETQRTTRKHRRHLHERSRRDVGRPRLDAQGLPFL